jgi:hypothetical protein
LLSSSLLLSAGCVPDECTADFVVSGPFEYTYALRESNSTCTATTTSSASLAVPGGLGWSASDGILLRITLLEGDLSVGTHSAIVLFGSTALGYWDNNGNPLGDPEPTTLCSVAITESEIVDWVQEDHRQVSGVVACQGPLLGGKSTDDPPLYISGLSFSVYAGEQPF